MKAGGAGADLLFAADRPLPTADSSSEGMFEFRDRWYLLMGVDLAEYRDHMRRRSAKWETVCLPAEDFRSLARPIESWL